LLRERRARVGSEDEEAGLEARAHWLAGDAVTE